MAFLKNKDEYINELAELIYKGESKAGKIGYGDIEFDELDTETEYNIAAKFGYQGGAALWYELGNSSLNMTVAGEKYKVVYLEEPNEFGITGFALNNGRIYAIDEYGEIVLHTNVAYDEDAKITKKQVKKAFEKQAEKFASENPKRKMHNQKPNQKDMPSVKQASKASKGILYNASQLLSLNVAKGAKFSIIGYSADTGAMHSNVAFRIDNIEVNAGESFGDAAMKAQVEWTMRDVRTEGTDTEVYAYICMVYDRKGQHIATLQGKARKGAQINFTW